MPAASGVTGVGIAYTVVVGLLVYRRFDWKRVYPMMVETASLSGAILLIIGCATAMAWALTRSGFSHQLANAMSAMPGGHAGFMAVSVLAFIVLGSVLEGIPATVLFGPLRLRRARRRPVEHGVLGSPVRERVYRELWGGAARACGATLTDLGGSFYELARDGAVVRVMGQMTALDDPVAMREELGDVLLQVVFHARVAAEAALERRFDVDAVAGDLVDKLVRRHPHVFGDAGPRDVEQVEAGDDQTGDDQAGANPDEAYEVEVRDDDGTSWDVSLDADFEVLAKTADD